MVVLPCMQSRTYEDLCHSLHRQAFMIAYKHVMSVSAQDQSDPLTHPCMSIRKKQKEKKKDRLNLVEAQDSGSQTRLIF